MSRLGGQFALALAAVCGGLLAGRAAGEELWELEPYRIGVVAVGDGSPTLDAALAESTATQAAARLAAEIGAPWALATLTADAELAPRLARAVEMELPGEEIAESLPAEWRKLDKIFVASLAIEGGGVRLAVREYDTRVESWSPPSADWVAQRAQLSAAVARAAREAFAPLARIEVGEKEILLRFKASRLPPRDSSLRFATEGDVFQPFLRTPNRDATTRRVQPIPWTFLSLAVQTNDAWRATVVSGLRSPLSARRRGRAEQLALRVRTSPTPTLLRLRSRTEPDKPLAGYDVFELGATPEQTRLLGATDAKGELEIAPAEGRPLRTMVVKHGGLLVARFPIVAGWRAVETVPIPDDDLRLEYEGRIVALQEEIVDHVARRGALVLQIRGRLDAGQLAEARTLYDRLRDQPGRAAFAARLAQLRSQIAAANLKDPQTQARIAQMLVDTEKVLATYLQTDELRELEKELKDRENEEK